MTKLTRILATFALAAVMAVAAASQGSTQNESKAPVIALINYAGIMKESKAGKSVNAQIVEQRETYLTEIKNVQAALEKEAKELEQQQSILAQDVFEAKVVEFRRKQREAKQTENGYRRALDQMQANGLRAIEEELNKILEAIAEERGIDIVMKAGTPASPIVKARKELFITDDVIAKLDEQLPKVSIPPVAQ